MKNKKLLNDLTAIKNIYSGRDFIFAQIFMNTL
jgi:hypothetical protein